LRTTLIAAVRDEGPFLLEWVAHHLTIGFDRIVIASNDSTDGTHEVLDAMAAAGFITHYQHDIDPGKSPQAESYKALRRQCAVDATDWLMVMDVDEFLNVHVGDRSLQALIASAPDHADIIALNSATFGANGPDRWRPRPVTAQFHWRMPTHDTASSPVKSLTRHPARFKEIHNHSLVGFKGERLTYMDASGHVHDLDLTIPLWRQLRNFPAHACSHDLAQYNHYAVKTYDTYLARRDRGRGAGKMGMPNDRHTDAYFHARATGTVRDDTIQQYAPRVLAQMQVMLADARIATWQEKCERRYRRRMRAIWAQINAAVPLAN
jgi:Glycosyl transferase family 2